MPRLAIRRAILRQFLKPALIYAAGCLVALLVALNLGDAWMPLLFMLGGGAILLTWRRTPWPDQWSRYASLGALLLLVCALNRCFYVADYFVNGTKFDQWPFFVQKPQVAVFKGEVMAIFGTMLTVFAWRACGGLRVSPSLIMSRPRHNYRVMQVIYATSLAGMFVTERVPELTDSLGQLLPALLGLGLVSTFLIPMTRFHNRLARLGATIVLSAPFFFLASQSGSKQRLILALIPSAIMLWMAFRSRLARASMIACALVGLALVTSYVNLYRTKVWYPQSHGLPVSESVPQDFAHEIRSKGLAETSGDGLAAFVDRSDGSYTHGWAVSIADEQSFHPRLIFAPLAYVFVPRMIWPGKPDVLQGYEYTALVFGQPYMSSTRTSTAAGFYAALYLGLGWPAVVVGALAIGAILASTTRVAKRFGGPLGAGLYVFSMVPFMLHMNEGWTVGTFSGPIIGLVYVLAIVKLARVVTQVITRTQRSPERPA